MGGSGGISGEEERIFQGRGLVEFEVEGETGRTGSKRSEPIYKGAVRIQGKAGLEDRESIPDEKVERVDQLSTHMCFWRCCVEVAVGGLTEIPGCLYIFCPVTTSDNRIS